MTPQSQVETAFPTLARIEDEQLRDQVVDAWARALDETGRTLAELPWYPPVEAELGMADATLVDHVNDVTEVAIAIAETLRERQGVDLSLDTVIAGALIHDVSKVYEFDADGDPTEIERLLPHPHFGAHVAARADLPTELVHIAVSHNPTTAVDPKTLAARVVQRADVMAAEGLISPYTDDLSGFF